jgi:lysophospholipase L1-like esterase
MDRKKKIILGIGIGLALVSTIVLFWVARKRKDGGGQKSNVTNKNPKKILIAGDSQVAIQNESGGKITYTYPNILKAELEPQGYEIDVVAIGGKTTDWIKENLQKKLNEKKYDRVYIHGGGNDVNNASISLEHSVANFQAMTDSIKQTGADPFIVLGYKIEGTDGKFGNYNIMSLTKYLKKKEEWIPYIEKRKELQRRLPNEVSGSSFVPIYDLQQNTNDGVHPNGDGHKIVAMKIKDSILNQ